MDIYQVRFQVEAQADQDLDQADQDLDLADQD
jgi:hypothetical protein